ncbi:NucA/NucB deoxyribonuclease domain-containing protein [Sabulicella rubraurantiaca]|uniref:NucA/NucB deoxyribonuclease domain-containing protein n=1 Tax=Sabulicella rubraurantiaca TaxID=2811429 RepID=UPI001A95F5ED|nr:NucA/NucB deoxyribonuclease domain-containing protein [Sabulicella rubraurantiaca]
MFEVDGRADRTLAENIWHAQQAGWPDVLTYDPEKDQNRRKQVMSCPEGHVPAINGKRLHRDEYPFFCTKENTYSAWIGHLVAEESLSQGGQLKAFLRANGVYNGYTNFEDSKGKHFKFVVRVKNWPPPKTGR